jgi:hypothetical protein
MRLSRLAINALMLFTVCLFCASFAQAQATRTWVSGVGDDANPCSRTAPCKTFAGAISKTAAGGEINCLDPGGFGAVTITKAITIDGSGTFASILASSVNGVVINAGANDKIILRGLSINGGGTGGLNGISFLAGASLHVEDTVISNMQNGINVGLNNAANREVYIKNTYIRNNSNVGVFISNAGAGLVDTVIEKTTIENNVFGLIGRNNARVTTRESVYSGNSTTGILAEVQVAGPTAEINVDSCVVTANGTGLSAGNSAAANQGILRVSNTFISRNTTGVAAGNGNAGTFGDNKLQGNTANGAFTLPALGKN